MPRNPHKWIWTDLAESARTLNPKQVGVNGTVSLAPRYEGRGWHNPAKWEAVITIPVAGGQVEIRHSFEVTLINTNDENLWRRAWARARAMVNYQQGNGELKAIIDQKLHEVPSVITGSNTDADMVAINNAMFGEA